MRKRCFGIRKAEDTAGKRITPAGQDKSMRQEKSRAAYQQRCRRSKYAHTAPDEAGELIDITGRPVNRRDNDRRYDASPGIGSSSLPPDKRQRQGN